MLLVESWWKKWSVQILAACIAVAELSAYLPEVREYLPPEWYRFAFLLILVARVVSQKRAEAGDAP